MATTSAPEPREALPTLAAGAWVLAFFLVQLPFDPDYFFHDDMQLQYVPGSLRIGATLLGGELPTITPSVWAGGALAGEYQFGVFSVFRLGLDAGFRVLGLGLRATAAALCLAHLFVLATGVFRWARTVEVDPRRATVAAFVVATSGWVTSWGCNWLPALASFAWLPWYLAALERAARSGAASRFVTPGLFAYLILAAGWPYTVLMMALVTGWWCARALGRERRVGAVLPAVGALGLGALLAAPALATFVEYARTTMRVTQGRLSSGWVVPLSAWPSLFLPGFVTIWTPTSDHNYMQHVGLELACGVWPVAVLFALRRPTLERLAARHGSELALLAIAGALCVLPSLGTFQWSFRWLPLFHLLLALVAVRADALREAPRSLGAHPAWPAVVVVVLAWAWDRHRGYGDPATLRWMAGCLVMLLAAWALAETAVPRSSPLARAFPLALVIGAQGVTYTLVRPWNEMLVWPVGEELRGPGPFSRDRLYLAIVDRGDVHPTLEGSLHPGERMRPGSLPSLAGLRFVNGYSPMHPRGLAEVFAMGRPDRIGVGTHGDLDPSLMPALFEVGADHGGIVDRLGIDGLVVPILGNRKPPLAALRARGWVLARTLADAHLFHRPSVAADARCVDEVVHVTTAGAVAVDAYDPARRLRGHLLLGGRPAGHIERFAECTFGPVLERETSVAVDVSVAPLAPGLVVFRRAWDVGYQAHLDGLPLPVSAYEAVALAVRVPAGARGRLVVRHRPLVLPLGFGCVGLGVVAIVVAKLRDRRRAA